MGPQPCAAPQVPSQAAQHKLTKCLQLALAAIFLGEAFAYTVLDPYLPQAFPDASSAALSMVFGAYSLAQLLAAAALLFVLALPQAAAMQPSHDTLISITAFTGFTVAGVLPVAVPDSLSVLLAQRAILGVCAAGFFVFSYKGVARAFQPQVALRAAAWISAGLVAGDSAAPVVGAAMFRQAGLRAANAMQPSMCCVGLLLALCALLQQRRLRRQQQQQQQAKDVAAVVLVHDADAIACGPLRKQASCPQQLQRVDSVPPADGVARCHETTAAIDITHSIPSLGNSGESSSSGSDRSPGSAIRRGVSDAGARSQPSPGHAVVAAQLHAHALKYGEAMSPLSTASLTSQTTPGQQPHHQSTQPGGRSSDSHSSNYLSALKHAFTHPVAMCQLLLLVWTQAVRCLITILLPVALLDQAAWVVPVCFSIQACSAVVTPFLVEGGLSRRPKAPTHLLMAVMALCMSAASTYMLFPAAAAGSIAASTAGGAGSLAPELAQVMVMGVVFGAAYSGIEVLVYKHVADALAASGGQLAVDVGAMTYTSFYNVGNLLGGMVGGALARFSHLQQVGAIAGVSGFCCVQAVVMATQHYVAAAADKGNKLHPHP